MFWLRLCLILWLSPNVIFRDRVVQGFLRWGPFGGAGEHQSLDSVPWNSREFHNTQQNVQNDEQNHNVHSTYPVNSDFSSPYKNKKKTKKKKYEEPTNWAEDEISPAGEWYNYPDSASNFEEALNPYHRDPWNSAPVDHSSFSGQIHQHQAYPQEGSSHDQGSSSNNVQHNYEGDVFRENNSNFVPHFNEFWYPDSSFEHHPHQNFEISHDEQMTQDPAFYSMLNDLSYSPHHYDVENRDYQKHEKINFVKYEGKSGLISTLKNEFSKHPLGTELEFMSHESWGVNVGHLTTKNAEWKEHTVIDYTLQIDWKGAEALKINIRSLANTYKNYGFLPKGRGGTVDHIENISIWGITFMKIIAKTYSNNPVSEFFGSHQSLYDYTERFWNFCFTTDGKTEELRNFFGSLGKECSQEDTGHFISTKFLNEYNTPGNIFSMIKQEITGHTEMQVTYMFSWYFVFFRAMVYYPQLIFDDKINSGRQLKELIEEGIVKFFEGGKLV